MAIFVEAPLATCCGESDAALATRSPRTVSACLARDHRGIDGLLNDVESLAREGDFKAAHSAFAPFRKRLERYIETEEDALFPLYEQLTGCNGPTSVMRGEHTHIRRLMAAIEASFQSPQFSHPVELTVELARLLNAHNVTEKGALYARADAVIGTGSALGVVVARIEDLLECGAGQWVAATSVSSRASPSSRGVVTRWTLAVARSS